MPQHKRVFYPFWEWEDIGMWRDVSASEQRELYDKAVEFTGDAARYGAAMLEVVDLFPVACEHNLTEPAMNRRAWIGHAACYLAFQCPEYIVREAWGALTEQQRIEADMMADRAIRKWEWSYAQKVRRLHPQLEIKGI